MKCSITTCKNEAFPDGIYCPKCEDLLFEAEQEYIKEARLREIGGLK